MGERVLFLDCTAGISGDMLLGALVDLGVPLAHLRSELAKLEVEGFRLARSRGSRGGVAGSSIRVATPRDRGYRHWEVFERVLRRSGLSSETKSRSLELLRRLFEAEARVHGTTPEKVHLHELGSLDTLVDVVGAVVAVSSLAASEIVSSPVNLGGGFVDTEHGRMSVPAPATALLLAGAPVFSEEGDGLERTTPTGALLASGLADRFGGFPPMVLRKIGYGLGTQDPDGGRPNALRAVLGERAPSQDRRESVLVVEATVDDMTPQQMGYLQEKLLSASVLDVFLTPVQMKKNRPGLNLTVLARPGSLEAVSAILFSEGTTLGVRYHEASREVLPRRLVSARTPYGTVKVKEGIYDGRVVHRMPEFEDCRRLATKKKVPLKEVQRAALEAARKEGQKDRRDQTDRTDRTERKRT